MRESNFQFPSQNRAVVAITHMLYDRRALDTGSPLAILNNLTSLTYLTSTSPRIREILTLDGGLERLLDILRESTLPRQTTLEPDLWGLNGPPTARVISVDRQTLLKHSLAFQCVVNIGVRGSEQIRTRVVQGGALDLVAQILESWLREHGIAIFASHYGSQAAVDATRSGQPVPGALERRRRIDGARATPGGATSGGTSGQGPSSRTSSITSFLSTINPRSLTRLDPSRLAGGLFPRAAARQDVPPIPNQLAEALVPVERTQDDHRGEEADVDMAEGEADADADMDGSSIGADESMDLDEPSRASEPTAEAGPSTTPRASRLVLPMTMTQPIPIRPPPPLETPSQASSATGSASDAADEQLPRIISDGNLQATSEPRAPGFIGDSRLTHLAHAGISTQSSPAGTPTRAEMGEVRHRRRDTIVARPLHLVPRNERDRGDGGSELSDGGPDVDIMTATIAAGVAAAQNLAGEGGMIADVQDGGNEDRLDVAMPPDDGIMGEPDQEALEREQARLDMEAGAPPTQLAAAAAAIQQTPMAEAPTPRQQPVLPPPTALVPGAATAAAAGATEDPPASIIIASGAPRGFQDLGSYVGISSLLHPHGDRYSDDSILLALQLLAYLSKYPHVRAAFHHPRKPMHPTFDLSAEPNNPLPERPACSETPNIFALVERFTFRPSPSDPLLFKVPSEIQYWAGVIMRNACRKDDLRGGIRQCAHMSCGKWENYAREFAKCRRCRKAKYCSKDCQSAAWSEGHKFWCSARGEGEGAAAHGGAGGGGAPRPPGGEDEDGDSDFSNLDPPRERQRRDRREAGGGGGAVPGAATGRTRAVMGAVASPAPILPNNFPLQPRPDLTTINSPLPPSATAALPGRPVPWSHWVAQERALGLAAAPAPACTSLHPGLE